jgi:hypothetical protein
VSSTVRSGVALGVGALSWIAFLPSALVFGIVSKQTSVHTASWRIVAATVGVGILPVAMAIRMRADPWSTSGFAVDKGRHPIQDQIEAKL